MKLTVALQSIFLIVLFIIILLQRCDNDPIVPDIQYDTIVQIDTIHDTIPGKPIYIVTKPDTTWITEYPPDSNCNTLRQQYIELGNKFFAENTFSTTFPIDSFGSIRVEDKIKGNVLTGTTLFTNLEIPTKFIYITKTSPPNRQLYVGAIVRANLTDYRMWPELGVMYKDRKDRMFGGSFGYNGEMEVTASTYWKINLKKK